MIIEATQEAPQDLPERQTSPLEASTYHEEEYPFHIVPAPPIPGQTGWSIVPW